MDKDPWNIFIRKLIINAESLKWMKDKNSY